MSRNARKGVAGNRPTRPDDGRAERSQRMFGDYGKMTVEEFLPRSQLQAMHQAISLTFERALKSDIYLQAAKRGEDDFYFLLDSNSAMLAESVLGLYQRIFNEIINVDPSL